MRIAIVLLALAATGMARADEKSETSGLPVSPGEIPPKSTPAPPRANSVFVSPASSVNASDALDEILDELAGDVARLGETRVSPMLVERVAVSGGLNPDFARVLESRLSGAVLRAANVRVLRCNECLATQARVERGELVVTRGLGRLDEQKRIAALYGARTLLSASLAHHADADALVLDVQLVRAEDSAVLFAEAYRFDARTALLHRGADRAQLREERLMDLLDRVDGRPHYGHGIFAGTMLMPVTGAMEGRIRGAVGSYRLYERFGDERQHAAGFSIGGFVNDTELAAALLMVTVATQLTKKNVYRPSLHVGAAAGGVLTGMAGNSSAVQVFTELHMVHRIGLQASLTYVRPFEVKQKGEFGGFCPGGGLVMTW